MERADQSLGDADDRAGQRHTGAPRTAQARRSRSEHRHLARGAGSSLRRTAADRSRGIPGRRRTDVQKAHRSGSRRRPERRCRTDPGHTEYSRAVGRAGQLAGHWGGGQPVRDLGADAGTTPPASRLNPILGIHVDQQVTDLGVVDRGSQTGLTCNTNAAYAYQDRHRWTMITLTAMPQELVDQVTYEWTINGEAIGPDRSEQFVPARTYDGSELPTHGRIQRILSPTRVQLTINHSPSRRQPQPVRAMRCAQRLRPACRARRGADHHRSSTAIRSQLHRRPRQLRAAPGGRARPWTGEVAAGPGRSGGVAGPADRGPHRPTIQRDAVSRASAGPLRSLIGLLNSKGGSQPWLEQLRPNLSGAMSIGRRQSEPR